ncbi:MAG: hypothetical protein NC453_12030 [Muribaculum sp.]|nr:hypothetical protein [Muribaculum sp.]
MELAKGSRSISSTINIEMPIIELVFALFCCLVIKQACMFPPKRTLAIKLNRLGTHLANFSYTLYLTHMVVLKLMVHYGMPKSATVNIHSMMLYSIEVLIALTSAYAIYYLFERNTKKLKNFLLSLTSGK